MEYTSSNKMPTDKEKKGRKMSQAVKKESRKTASKTVGSQIVPIGNRKNADLDAMTISAQQISAMRDKSLVTAKYCDNKKIIYPEMSNRGVANTFREIRTKMLALSQGRNFVAMVTSVGSRGGASFVSLNLATAFSFEESKSSLLIDCNLRQPKLHSMVDLKQKKGLTDYLENTKIDLEEIIYPSGISRLRLIPIGKKRESVVEYFTSARMKRFLDTVHMRYMDRFIFLDAPPIGESVDARILAELCDLVVLVVDYGKVTESKLQAAVEGIGKEKLAGVVFNREPDMVFT